MVFSGVNNTREFAACLNAIKDVKFRQVANKFYLPLKYFHASRLALRDYSGKISLSSRYLLFANRFVAKEAGPIVIDWYPQVCKIKGTSIPFEDIIPATSYFTKSAIRSKAYEKGTWDGCVHLFDVLKGEFPSGLIERIVQILNEKQIPYTLNRRFEYPKPYFQLHPVFSFTPEPDQIAATEALDKANNGIAKLPTGFGKTSYVAAALIAKKGVRSLFLANQRVLINDAKEDFKSVFQNDDIHIGTIGDGEYDPGDITVASIQGVVAALTPPTSLEITQAEGELQLAEFRANGSDDEKLNKEVKRLKNKVKRLKERVVKSKEILNFLKTIDLFIVDESQVLGTDMWDKFLYACPAPYRYTLSATDTRTDGGRIQIVAATGERRYESSASEQIEKGRLAEFKAFFKRFDHGISKEVIKELKMSYDQAYRLFIMENEKRNEFLCDYMIGWMNQGFSIIGLVTRKDHAVIIEDILRRKGLEDGTHFNYVDGDTSKKKRNELINSYRAGEFPILLGTSIFDVGFNAKNASKIVRFNGGASEVRETQRAGRTVRKREDDSRGESIDILDLNVPFFQSQSFKRMKLLKEEFGEHRVQVLPGEIIAPFNADRLVDVANAAPTETDKEEMFEVIRKMKELRELADVDAPEVDVNKITKDPDLMDLLDELTVDLNNL